MYIGVDIGGTKTAVAVLDDAGIMLEKSSFKTPSTYDAFLTQLSAAVKAFSRTDFKAGCVAAPGRINRRLGIGQDFGNLPWHDVPIRSDAERLLNCPMLVENDANLGGLSESMLLPPDKRVLYITISTGIGTGFVSHQKIDPNLADSEGGHMILEYHGKRTKWEDFASGSAIVRRFGKKAADIQDDATWQRIAHDLSLGFIELMAIAQPEVVIVGGSVGRYFDRFAMFLLKELRAYQSPLVPIPPIKKASRPDDAVLYGCYDLAYTHYGTAR